MKFTIATTLALALAGPALAASCRRGDEFGSWVYGIEASGVDNVPGRCGGLWDNLKRFAACPVGVIAECTDRGNGNMRWEFSVGQGCNSGMVESTWWEATRNQFGSINCP